MMKKSRFRSARRSCSRILAVGISVALGSFAHGAVIDDFSSGDLSNYTATTILDNGGIGSNIYNYEVVGGALQLNTTSFDNIEQIAFIRNGLTLGVGQEVSADFSHTGNRSIGLFVGGSAPISANPGGAAGRFDTRSDFLIAYANNTTTAESRGYDGSTLLSFETGPATGYESLFIARIATNTFEVGYYSAGVRNVISTRTPTTPNSAEFVGFYNDARVAGVLGTIDNLRVTAIPEPGSLACLGLGTVLLGLHRRKRRA